MNANPVERLAKRYSDAQRAEAMAALAANGGPDRNGAIARTAKELGIPRATLRNWARSKRHPEALPSAATILLPLADRLESLAHKIVGFLEDETKLKAAPYSALVSGLSATVDKMRLLREQATSLSAQTVDPEARDKRLL